VTSLGAHFHGGCASAAGWFEYHRGRRTGRASGCDVCQRPRALQCAEERSPGSFSGAFAGPARGPLPGEGLRSPHAGAVAGSGRNGIARIHDERPRGPWSSALELGALRFESSRTVLFRPLDHRRCLSHGACLPSVVGRGAWVCRATGRSRSGEVHPAEEALVVAHRARFSGGAQWGSPISSLASRKGRALDGQEVRTTSRRPVLGCDRWLAGCSTGGGRRGPPVAGLCAAPAGSLCFRGGPGACGTAV